MGIRLTPRDTGPRIRRLLRCGAGLLAILVPIGLSSPAMSASGDLDATFGHAGIVRTSFVNAFDQYATSVAVQDDGRILVGGLAKLVGPKQVFALARYRRTGHLDPTFDGDGRVTSTAGHLANDIAVEPSGKIVVAGWAHRGDFALVRYRTNGSLNTSFGNRGKVITDICGPRCPDEINAVAIDDRGRIIAAGLSKTGLTLARYLSDGTLDNSFGNNGVVITDLGGTLDSAADVALQSDGKIVVVGESTDHDFAVARFTEHGSSDATFGNQGVVTTDFAGGSEDDAVALAIGQNGKIVAAGSSMCAGCSQFEFAVARYVPGGSLDTAFAGDGTTATSIGPGSDRAFGVLIQRGGKVLAVGGAGCHFELARFGGDGSLDASFGMQGTVRTDVGGCGVANDVARAGTGRVVVAGPAGSKFGAARYLAS